MASSDGDFGLARSKDRRHPEATFASPMSCRHSIVASRVVVRRAWDGVNEREEVVRRIVSASRVFLAQGSAESDSRR